MMDKITMHLANTEQDVQEVYYVRREVFGKEQGYRKQDLVVGSKPNEYHILCKKGGVPIGAVTCEQGNSLGSISLEQYFDLKPYYEQYGMVMYYSRHAIIKEYRGTTVALALYYFLWLFAKYRSCGFVVNVSRKDNKSVIAIMPKLGFKIAGECIYGSIGEVCVWKAELNDFLYDLDARKSRALHGIMPRIELPEIMQSVS
ncbi:hypothetical protein Ga0466249_004476 [Sporomusaceae bacterium BoRhaA]|uniref:hypothetical protein n=1 Tax=Pelorhabdus rhamnosifermentans TaxID=2772457 RepID=UPI001C06460C|nr:hypothetical protein [Pelorhabdus rhamnosifermentans]MBU2703331.1 hypothetical protein [Pelorhabdus rhamnosifermentans]